MIKEFITHENDYLGVREIADNQLLALLRETELLS